MGDGAIADLAKTCGETCSGIAASRRLWPGGQGEIFSFPRKAVSSSCHH